MKSEVIVQAYSVKGSSDSIKSICGSCVGDLCTSLTGKPPAEGTQKMWYSVMPPVGRVIIRVMVVEVAEAETMARLGTEKD